MLQPGHTQLITPQLKVLSEDQKETIYCTALEIMEIAGVRVDHPEGRSLLLDNGARLAGDGRIHIPSWLTQKALSTVPPYFHLYNRHGELAITVGGKHVNYCAQPDSGFIDDLETGQRRPFVRKDSGICGRVCDALPNIDMCSPSSMISDVPAEISYLLGHVDFMLGNTKPIMHGVLNPWQLEQLLELHTVLLGSREAIAERPVYLHYLMSISPHVHTEEGVTRLLTCAEYGIPVLTSGASAAGSTGPVTLAGNVATAIAESLTALVMGQLKKPGLPMVLGGVTTVADMRSGIFSYGAPELALMVAAQAEIAQYLKIPFMGTAGCTDAVTFDEQAVMEAYHSLWANTLAGANLIHDIGFTEAANHASLEFLLACDEMIGMLKAFMKGIEVTEETLALDVIKQVGPAGEYFTNPHTFNHCREHYVPSIAARQSYINWQAGGGKLYRERVKERLVDIIKTHEVPELPKEVLSELDKLEKVWWRAVA
jgi:trimethylamine--corrinoid protein Co-methyltransferase